MRTASFAALLIVGQFVLAQANGRMHSSETFDTNRNNDSSDLAKENLNRVAASALQIREALIGDAGLLVELKQWVAKEATDNGQVVEESDLSDQAIFDRLERDVVFRSVATRLLQRYGYLLPSLKPESPAAKEQDLLIKERVRRLAEIEAEEDSDSRRPRKTGQPQVEPNLTCDPEQDADCGKPRTQRVRNNREPDAPLPDNGPAITPDLQPPASSSRTLRTGLSNDGLAPRSSMPEIELASTVSKSRSENSLTQLPDLSAPDSLASARSIPPDAPMPRSRDLRGTDNRNAIQTSNPKSSAMQPLADVSPVKMVRSPNPYADVPSLYDMYVQAAAWQKPAERFGMDVFRNTSNQPDVIPMDLPVGPDYVVGTGDSLAIDLWGGVSTRLVRLVDREGRVSLPEAGPLLVSGKSLAEVQLDVQRVLRNEFRNVSADVSLARLRTVRVYIVGEVAEPGAYDISSLSTPLNALFAAGGITPRGSLRALRQSRGKQLVQQVDAYDLLLHGVRSDLKRLENGDTLLVPPAGPQVTVDGMVRRPAVYELLDETSLADVLELAGGILPTAALRHIEVQRVEAHEKRTMLSVNLSATSDLVEVNKQLQGFKVQDGDQVHIFPIASYNEQAIYLQGHVLRPGRYSYKQGMRVTDLISSYGDMLPEPAPHYAEIIRLNPPDFHPSVESFDISSVLADPASAPALKPLDTIRIFSRFDFELPPDVWVGGEVRSPGTYRTSGQAHLRDAIFLAGGATPNAAMDSAQLIRTQPDGTLKILSVDLKEALAGNPVDNVILQARDRVIIQRNLAKVDAPTVDVRGEVVKPGHYLLTSNMRVEDLVRVAGGLKRSAFADTADLTRFAAGNGSSEHVQVNLAGALAGDGNENLSLRNGDVLAIRQMPQWKDIGASVRVDGEVQHPATYGIQPGERLSSLLARCNGFTSEAYPYGAVLIRREIRDLEMKSHQELINRLKAEQTNLQLLPETDADQKNAKLSAIARTQTTLRELQNTQPLGRLVIHIPADLKKLSKSPADATLRNGDVLFIPKKTNYVVVSGEVFNPTAVSYLPGKSAKWYLSQSGGLTQIGDKGSVFVVRADGSVISSKSGSSLWSGDPLNAVMKPGDSIIVPEKTPKIAARNWAPVMQAAQVASSLALTVAYIHP